MKLEPQQFREKAVLLTPFTKRKLRLRVEKPALDLMASNWQRQHSSPGRTLSFLLCSSAFLGNLRASEDSDSTSLPDPWQKCSSSETGEYLSPTLQPPLGCRLSPSLTSSLSNVISTGSKGGVCGKKTSSWTSLVAWWIRVHLPVQGI